MPLDYVIRGGPAFSEIIVKLRPGQAVVADAGVMQWMKGAVQHAGLDVGGLKSFFGRLFSAEGLFLNRYVAEGGAGQVAFAACVPGDAFALDLAAGETWKMSRGAFTACTENVAISGKFNWRGLIPFGQEEGFVLPTATSRDGPGTLFVSAYGGYERHKLAPGERLLVDNGLFMACPADMEYELVKLGRSLASSFFGGEGIGMQFTGPGVVYTQSRNFNDLVGQIAARLPPPASGGGGEGGFRVSIGGGVRASRKKSPAPKILAKALTSRKKSPVAKPQKKSPAPRRR